MSRQHFQYFLESLLQDQWLIPTIYSIQDWFNTIDDLWFQGTFIDFTPMEVAVYSHWVLFLVAMISPDLPPTPNIPPLPLLGPTPPLHSWKQSDLTNAAPIPKKTKKEECWENI
ncbi:Hypothetical predicted protein [Marmota monax]|uniref:Uncharacterized protein n=1 Tax=Marmota monax TaxID=9995 RepID=A0A5E4BKT0_MARMO|nr:Hypothetical predicted protein [Marmota monax]